MRFRVIVGFTFGDTKVYPDWKVEIQKESKISTITIFDLNGNEITSGKIASIQLQKVFENNLEINESV